MNRAARRVRAAALLLPAKVAGDRYRRRLVEAFRGLHMHQDSMQDQMRRLQVLASKAFDEMSSVVRKRNGVAMATLLGKTPSEQGLTKHIAKFREQNLALIEQAGRDYFDDVASIINDPENFGLGADALADLLSERADVSESRAELIARDQTLKLNGQITQMRQENAGISQYIWSTSHDERVRPEHRDLDGSTQSWNDPPEPGHPGQDFQCRCVALPVIDEPP